MSLKKFNLFVFFFSLYMVGAMAQQTGTITILSQPLSGQSQQALIGAFVILKPVVIDKDKKEEYLFSDDNGQILNTHPEPMIIYIHSIGYEDYADTLQPGVHYVFHLIQKNNGLGQVVVTGQYDYVTDDKSVYNIKVITAKDIQLRGSTNLNDLLQNELGLKLTQDNILGSTVSINGINGQNVKILIDGVPVIGRENGNIDISQINLNDIDHIEIVEGPMSVSYGTDALGGAINLITKKTFTYPLAINLHSQIESVGTYNLDGGFNVRSKKITFAMNGGRNFFQGFNPVDTGRFTEWKPKEQYFANLLFSWKVNHVENTFKSYAMKQLTLNKGEVIMTPYQAYAFDDYYFTRRLNNSLFTEVHLKNNSVFNFTHAYSYYNRIKNTYRKNLVSMENILVNSESAQDTSTFGTALFRGTYSTNIPLHKVNYQVGYEVTLEKGISNKLKDRKQFINDYAVFSSVEYKPLKQLFIRPGIRYTYNTRYGAPLVPSLNVKYDFNQKYSLRGSYAKGFRAPSLKELNLLFVDANHNIQGNDSLRAEHSDNISFSFNYSTLFQNDILKLEFTTFYNSIHNIIELGLIDPATQYYSYVNIEKFKTAGFNFGAQLKGERFSFQTGFSFIGTYNSLSDSFQVDKFLITPEFKNNFTVRFPKVKLDAAIFFKSTGTTPGFAFDNSGKLIQTFTQPFNIVDITFNKTLFAERIQWSAGVRNLFNVINITTNSLSGEFHVNDENFVPYSIGRFFFTSLRFNLFKSK